MIPKGFKGWMLVPALALSLALIAPEHASAKTKKVVKGKTWTWSFAADTLGRPPGECLVLGGDWEVVADSSSPGDTTAAARLLRQTEADDGVSFHYIQFPKPVLNDVRVSVRFRILSGEMDPSVGIAFQLDAKGRNGYLVRVRAENADVAAHYLIYKKRRDIKFAKIEAPAKGAWHELAVERTGSELVVFYDGVEEMRVRDERFRSGAVGLWTEDDTIAEFRDLAVTSR